MHIFVAWYSLWSDFIIQFSLGMTGNNYISKTDSWLSFMSVFKNRDNIKVGLNSSEDTRL